MINKLYRLVQLTLTIWIIETREEHLTVFWRILIDGCQDELDAIVRIVR